MFIWRLGCKDETKTGNDRVKQTQLVPSLGVMAAGAFWGLLWLPFVEFDKQGMGVGLSSTIFYAVTALCAVPGLLATGAARQVVNTPFPYIIMGTAFTLYTFALLLTLPINAILLFYLTPVWSILLGKFLNGEAIGLVRSLVVLMGFVGTGLVLGATSLPIPQNLGDWLGLMAGALWALSTSLTSRDHGKNSWARLLQFSIAGLLSTVVLAFVLSGMAPKILTATASTSLYFWAVVIGFVLFTIPNMLVIWGTTRLSSTRIGVLLMMEVVVGTIAIGYLSAQPLAALQIGGAVMIFATGIVEVISRDSHQASERSD
jgi:drug/metabolite transporter (DMT)-like permease